MNISFSSLYNHFISLCDHSVSLVKERLQLALITQQHINAAIISIAIGSIAFVYLNKQYFFKAKCSSPESVEVKVSEVFEETVVQKAQQGKEKEKIKVEGSIDSNSQLSDSQNVLPDTSKDDSNSQLSDSQNVLPDTSEDDSNSQLSDSQNVLPDTSEEKFSTGSLPVISKSAEENQESQPGSSTPVGNSNKKERTLLDSSFSGFSDQINNGDESDSLDEWGALSPTSKPKTRSKAQNSFCTPEHGNAANRFDGWSPFGSPLLVNDRVAKARVKELRNSMHRRRSSINLDNLSEFKKNPLTEFKKITLEDGTTKEGYFIDGRLDGKGTICFPDGNRFTGIFSDDELNGEGVFTCENGTTVQRIFKGSQNLLSSPCQVFDGHCKVINGDIVTEGVFNKGELVEWS